jgi:hypothetical protein
VEQNKGLIKRYTGMEQDTTYRMDQDALETNRIPKDRKEYLRIEEVVRMEQKQEYCIWLGYD